RQQWQFAGVCLRGYGFRECGASTGFALTRSIHGYGAKAVEHGQLATNNESGRAAVQHAGSLGRCHSANAPGAARWLRRRPRQRRSGPHPLWVRHAGALRPSFLLLMEARPLRPVGAEWAITSGGKRIPTVAPAARSAPATAVAL